MSITAIQGICHDGKIEPLEKIPYKTDKKVIIVFWMILKIEYGKTQLRQIL